MNKNQMFDFVILLGDKTSKQDVLNIQQQLQIYKFESLFYETIQKEMFLFCKLRDTYVILKEAEFLEFRKIPLKKIESDHEFFKCQLPQEILELEQYRKFKYFDRHDFLNVDEDYQKIFSSAEILMIISSILERMEFNKKNFLHYFQQKQIILDYIPFHENNIQIDSLTQINNYYGENIAIYFELLEFMQKWIFPTAIIGIITMFLNQIYNDNVNDSPWDALYSVIMIIWASIFCAFWKKHEKNLQMKWSFNNKIKKDIHIFTGELELNTDLVTGKLVETFPLQKKIYRFFISYLITIPIILFTICILIISLNLRGEVFKNHYLIYFESISYYSQEGQYNTQKYIDLLLYQDFKYIFMIIKGQIFDKNSNAAYLTTILHVIVLMIINLYYSQLSHTLTMKEGHLTKKSFQDSLITKRFLFETFNTFLDLFYIAFVTMNIESLKFNLISMYSVDELRRVFTETIVPLAQKKIILKRSKLVDTNQFIEDKLQEIKLPKYEPFDDYLEIIINFGYITIFASAFPLASLLIFIFHQVELYSDKFKLQSLYQRSWPQKQNGIGSWLTVLNIMSYACVFTNIILFAFASDKIAEFFPFLFNDHDAQNIKLGQGKYLVAIITFIEHILILIIILTRKCISILPSWSSLYAQRQVYFHKIENQI